MASQGPGRIVPVRLSASLLAAADERAQAEATSRSAVIRAALVAHLRHEDSPESGRLALTADQLDKVGALCHRFGVSRLEVFGSFARGEATASSDVDLLYTMKPGARLGWEIEDLTDALAAVFGRPVDLIARHAVHERMRPDVLADAEVLYAA